MIGIRAEGQIFDRDLAEAEVTNTITETTVYSVSVPGGTLGIDRMLRVSLIGLYSNNDGAARDVTIKAKYGGTTIFDSGLVNLANNVDNRAVSFELKLSAGGATNNQDTFGELLIGLAAGTTGFSSTGDPAAHRVATYSDLAINSSVAQTLAITVQHGTASLNITLRVEAVQTELI